jgi:hypothetical protein
MRKLKDNPFVNVIFQSLLEIMAFLKMLNGQKGFTLVGLAVRPGCSVVANPKEGLIFNYQCANVPMELTRRKSMYNSINDH